MTEGIHPDVTAKAYHADCCAFPSLSSTVAKMLVNESPKHAWAAHPRLGGARVADDDGEATDPKATKEKELGTLIHRIVLGKGGDIFQITAADYRTNDAKAKRDAAKAAGRIPVLTHKLPEAEAAAGSCLGQLADMGYGHIFTSGMKEVVMIWRDGDDWLRAMVDNLIIDEASRTAEIYDLKTVGRSSHPNACATQISTLGYDMSLSFYARGLATLRPDLAGRIKSSWVFLETKKPYAATPVEISGEWKMAAEMKTDRAIALWKKCMETKRWPYYCDTRVRLEPKPWDIAAALMMEENA